MTTTREVFSLIKTQFARTQCFSLTINTKNILIMNTAYNYSQKVLLTRTQQITINHRK